MTDAASDLLASTATQAIGTALPENRAAASIGAQAAVTRRLMASHGFRHGLLELQTRRSVAAQMRALRGSRTQVEFAAILGKPQSVVSRLEDPFYEGCSIHTLLDVASKLDCALIVQFAGFSDPRPAGKV